MPRTLLFEETNRIFVLERWDDNGNGTIKVVFEHNKAIFLHENHVYPKCNCGLNAQDCICMNLDLVIRIVDDQPTELLKVSG